MPSTSHRFGRYELRPAQRSLLVDGQAVPLGARAFDVLAALIDWRERVVSASELFDRVWPSLVVEENNLRQQIAALRKLLGADAIVTVPGRGYRFALRLAEDAVTAGAVIADASPVAPPHKPSIAVLPLAVLSDDPRIAFLADGLAEDVIALLARVPGFLLISRASSFEFRKRSESVGAIALKLGVRYIVEGSVRPVDGRVRVSTQLVEAASGRVLWSGRHDGEIDDTTDVQEAIARGVMSQLEPELTRAEIALIRRQRPDNVDAWGHYRQAVASIAIKGWTESALHDARSHFQSALVIDPSFSLARAHFALITALGLESGLVESSAAALAEAAAAAEQAIADEDGDTSVLGYAGCALADLGQHERGIEVLERALQIDPSNAQAHVALGATMALGGDWDAGIERMRYGMRISPCDRRLGFWGSALGLFQLRAGHTEEALAAACTSALRDPRLYLARIVEAAALQALGRGAEAQDAFAVARTLRPTLSRAGVASSHGKRVASLLEPLWGDAAR